MASKSHFAKDIKERMKHLKSPEDTLCIGSMTMSSYISSSREAMVTQHLVQALIPDHPEIPAVFTGNEYTFGHFSNGYKKTDTKLKIVKKIVKFDDFVYILLVYDPKKDMYDIIERNEVRNMAESYGYKNDNEVIDSYKQGDTIPKNTTLYKSPCFDEYQNYMYGVNANVVYVISQETIEDAVVIRESFAKKLSTTKVDTCEISFNDNDIFLNLYGDNENYKAFPDIGETIKDSVICATRRKNKTLDQYSLKNSNLKKIFPNDDIFQILGKWQIVDVNMWSNKSYDDIPDLPAYKQVKTYYKRILDYYTEIYNVFGKIIDEGTSKYSTKLSTLYAKARDFLDPSCKYVEEDKLFSNMIIEFTMAKSEPLTRGCKLCGRYGNKSVISRVIPDEEMGITEDGIVPDIRMDALGILGRLNSGQCIEQELNWIAQLVKKKMLAESNPKKQLDILFKFLKRVSPDEYSKMKDYVDTFKSFPDKDIKLKEYVNSILNDRIYIMQSPVTPISGDDLWQLYKEYEPEKTYITYKDVDGEYRSMRSLIVAEEYILRLKQEPITKISNRSKSLINPRTFLPIKSTKASKHKIIYPDQSNRIGEQELNILMLSNDSDALDYFYRSHSSSVVGRRSDTLFTEDPDNGFIINMDNENSRVVDMFNAYMKTLGLRLDIECDDDPDEPVDIECDVPDMPDYMNDMFD